MGQSEVVKETSPQVRGTPAVPDALIGEANECTAFVDGNAGLALLDTGSQVTSIAESFYRHHLTSRPITPISDLVRVVGGGGQNVPFIGYVTVDIRFPRDEMGADDTFETLALVVPDNQYNARVPLVIGTNLATQCKDSCEQQRGLLFSQHTKLCSAWRRTYKSLGYHKRVFGKGNRNAMQIKSASRRPIMIGSHETICIWGLARSVPGLAVKAIIESGEGRAQTEGLTVTPSLVTLSPRGAKCRVPVEVTNNSPHPLILPPRTVVATAHLVQGVTQPPGRDQGQQSLGGEQTTHVKVELSDAPLTVAQKEEVRRMLDRMSHVFARDGKDLGCANAVRHDIKLTDDQPFRSPHRRVPPAQFEEFRAAVSDLLEAGIIRESKSPYASPVVLVRKKDGTLRVCVDFRRLNAKTIRDSYPLPRITETLESLQGATWFCSLDLQSGYLQVEVTEDDKQKTAMTTPFGLFEYNRMPFGLTNAPATFQRLMERCLTGLNMKTCFAYLDDVIVFASSFDDMLNRLEAVLQRLSEYGLKLKPSKCKLFQTQVTYLGHVVSGEGVGPDPEKLVALTEWRKHPPKNGKELQTFLGFAGYYRSFVEGFASIAAPLHSLIAQSKTTVHNKPRPTFRWTDACQNAFETLIGKLSSAPVLAFPDFSLPAFVLHTDASGDGLGAVLYQTHDEKPRVIAYGSRSLQPAEQRYSAYRREFLALKWAVTEKFQSYLYGRKFQIVTDCNPLTYLLTTAKLNATDHRWLSSLASFDFTISYRPGKSNGDADGLSRMPQPDGHVKPPPVPDEEYIKPFLARVHQSADEDVCSNEEFQAICAYHLAGAAFRTDGVGTPAIEAISMQSEAVPHTLVTPPMPSQTDLRMMSPAEWTRLQEADPIIGRVLDILERDIVPQHHPKAEAPDVLRLLKDRDRMSLRDGILFRRRIVDGSETFQLVLPASLHNATLRGLHDDVGHLGKDKTLDLVGQRFYWPGMTRDVESYIKDCARCIKRKAPDPPRAPLVPILATEPMELLAMDFLSIEKGKGGFENVLVVTDSFTKFAWAFPTRNQKATTVARLLWEKVLVNYGFPQRLHSDQGKDFDSRLIKELCKVANIEKTRTTPYHPQGNGQTERFNRTLLGMLGTLDADKKTAWPDYVAPLTHAYNCTKHATTGYSPYLLMFGRVPRLPIDVTLGVPSQNRDTQPYSVFVEDLRARLAYTYDLASKGMEKKAVSNKLRYDSRAQETSLQPGDRVLVRNLTPRGKHKLQDRWEDTPYQVIRRAGDLPVYWLRKEGTRRERVLHRNLLLPFSQPEADPCEARPRATNRVPRPSPPAVAGPPIAPDDPVEPQQEDEADPAVLQVTTAGGKSNTELNIAAPPFLPEQHGRPADPDQAPDDGSNAGELEQHVPLPDPHETNHFEASDTEDPAISSVGSADQDEPPNEQSASEDQSSDLRAVPDTSNSNPTDNESGTTLPALEIPATTRSGRVTKPPERLVADPAWCQKASVLLSLVTDSNEHVAQNVLHGWFTGY